jgi:octaprenyl-diphosphate synthase
VQDICVGELSQIAGKFNFEIGEEQYFNLIRLKTAVLFSAACRLGAVDSGADPGLVEALAGYGAKVGIAFQIVDDCLDLTGDERVMGKSLGTDLAKGKLTLPLIRLFSKLPARGRKELGEMLCSPNGKDSRGEVVRLLRESDALSYALGRAREYINEAKATLGAAPASPYSDCLASLADFVVARRI